MSFVQFKRIVLDKKYIYLFICMINLTTEISHKYLNHGRYVPIQKCSKFNERSFLNNTVFSLIRSYSTFTNKDISSPLVKVYEKAYYMKKAIIKENIGKSGIYM
jgi:hypothetical protein